MCHPFFRQTWSLCLLILFLGISVPRTATEPPAPRDYTEDVKKWRQAAEQGDASAQYNLGEMYNNGVGVSQNKDEAREWLRKSAAQDYKPAQEDLTKLGLD